MNDDAIPERATARTAAWWRAQEMFLIQEVMNLVGKDVPLPTVLREILHLMSEMLGLNRGRIVLPDADGGFRIAHAYGLTRQESERGRYRRGEGITGGAIASGQLVLVPDITNDPTFLGRAVDRATLPPGPVSFAAAPIKVDGKVIGALACHRILRRDRPLSDEITLLKILSTLIGQLLTLDGRVERRTRELRQHNKMLEDALKAGRARYGIIGTAPLLLQAIGQIEKVAPATASVLLLGESGTGKELFARALHLASPRRDRAFIKVNCASIPESLFESELFGHEKGAFTGAATARAGWFEQASGGTLFLDEVGELPLAMQTKLLRTLQEGTVMRLGGKREITVDTRLVAATNRLLEQEVAQGSFREDLFYRLNVIPIRLPSLRDRASDVPELALSFIDRFNRDNQRNVSLSREAMTALSAHDWPGNVRQLSNFLERLVLLTHQTVVDREDIEKALAESEAAPSVIEPAAPLQPAAEYAADIHFRPYMRADSHTADDLRRALAASGGNKTRAAEALGMTGRQFAYRWQKLETT